MVKLGHVARTRQATRNLAIPICRWFLSRLTIDVGTGLASTKRSHSRSDCFLSGVSYARRGTNRRFHRKFILHKRTKATTAIASKIGEIANFLRNRMNHESSKFESHPVDSEFSRSAATRPRHAGLRTERADCLRFRDWNPRHLGLAVFSGRDWTLREF